MHRFNNSVLFITNHFRTALLLFQVNQYSEIDITYTSEQLYNQFESQGESEVNVKI